MLYRQSSFCLSLSLMCVCARAWVHAYVWVLRFSRSCGWGIYSSGTRQYINFYILNKCSAFIFKGPPNLLSNWLEQLFSQGYSDGGLKVRAPSSDNAKNKWSYTSSTKYAGIKRYVIEYRKCYCYRPIFMNIITTELTANKIFFVIAHNRLIFSKWKYTLTASVMGCRLAWYECNKTFE